MTTLMNGLMEETNFAVTENGALTHKSSLSALADLFALGGSYRKRSIADKVFLFKKAYDENPVLALKCLFYLRDVREGQGERDFFKDVLAWLVDYDIDAVRRNIANIAEYGRWDDIYCLVGTDLEKEAFDFLRNQYVLDMASAKSNAAVSLLGKWLKSINASSYETRQLAQKTMRAFGLNAKEYRKSLSLLREKIAVVEKLMSANRWDEIKFDQIPSKAGLIYRNAFARREMIAKKYEVFAKDENATVNTGALYPYEIVSQARNEAFKPLDNVNRLMVNKYWDNLKDYIQEGALNGLAVVDTSGSMTGCYGSSVAPIDVAISLGMYCAQKMQGPFAGHYISFSSRPQLIKVEGIDFVDSVERIYRTNLCENTNIEATFDLILNVAIKKGLKQEELPENLIIISDMEFDRARDCYRQGKKPLTLMESIEQKWIEAGYQMPKLVYWNVDARQDNIPMTMKHGISFVSGFSPILFEQIIKGVSAMDLILDKLNSERYALIK